MSPTPGTFANLDAARAISLATSRLCACEDRPSLCRTAVESARELLGVERCSIFLREGNVVQGTFGTDRHGATSDERNYRFPVNSFWEKLFGAPPLPGEQPWLVHEATYDEWDGQERVAFGRGDIVVTPILWQQQRTVAVFCNDHAISRRPIDRFQQDLLHVYCSLLGGILEKWRSEELLRRAQKMEALGSMAGGVAHDFNNFLAVIAGNAALLSRLVPEEGPLHPKIRSIHKAVDRAAILTRQLLIFSRRQVTQPVPLDLDQVVAEHEVMLQTLLGERGKVIVLGGSGRDAVLLDPTTVSQILFNLAANARDAMAPMGTLTIETLRLDVGESPPAGFAEAAPGPYVLLRVSDTGRGMPPPVLERLFEPFFTTKTEGSGTGLGLSTVYGIARKPAGIFRWSARRGGARRFRCCSPWRGVSVPQNSPCGNPGFSVHRRRAPREFCSWKTTRTCARSCARPSKGRGIASPRRPPRKKGSRRCKRPRNPTCFSWRMWFSRV